MPLSASVTSDETTKTLSVILSGRMFGAHCVALRLSLPTRMTPDITSKVFPMLKDPESRRARKTNISSMRLDEQAVAEINAILNENPLYSRSVVLRGAVLALTRLTRDQREKLILEAASR